MYFVYPFNSVNSIQLVFKCVIWQYQLLALSRIHLFQFACNFTQCCVCLATFLLIRNVVINLDEKKIKVKNLNLS